MVEPCYIQPWLTMVNHAFEKWHATVNHGQEQPKVTMVNHGQNLHIWPWLTMVKHDHIWPWLTMVDRVFEKWHHCWPWSNMQSFDHGWPWSLWIVFWPWLTVACHFSKTWLTMVWPWSKPMVEPWLTMVQPCFFRIIIFTFQSRYSCTWKLPFLK